MKKLIFTMIIIASALAIDARPNNSVLNLTIADRSFFSVELNGQYFPGPYRQFRAERLRNGTQFMRVTGNLRGSHHRQILFEGYVEISANSEITASIDRSGRLRILRVRPFGGIFPVYTQASICQYSNLGSLCHLRPGHSGSHCKQCFAGSQPCVNQYQTYGPHFQTQNQSHLGLMNQNDFNGLLNSLRRQSFESSRMQVLRQALVYNAVSSRQVGMLMDLMNFESSKLELAKMAYSSTIDKHNYYIVYERFTFSSSVDELARFLGNG